MRSAAGPLGQKAPGTRAKMVTKPGEEEGKGQLDMARAPDGVAHRLESESPGHDGRDDDQAGALRVVGRHRRNGAKGFCPRVVRASLPPGGAASERPTGPVVAVRVRHGLVVDEPCRRSAGLNATSSGCAGTRGVPALLGAGK